MKTFEVYGNFGKLQATIEAEDLQEAEEKACIYTTPVLVVEVTPKEKRNWEYGDNDPASPEQAWV